MQSIGYLLLWLSMYDNNFDINQQQLILHVSVWWQSWSVWQSHLCKRSICEVYHREWLLSNITLMPIKILLLYTWRRKYRFCEKSIYARESDFQISLILGKLFSPCSISCIHQPCFSTKANGYVVRKGTLQSTYRIAMQHHH